MLLIDHSFNSWEIHTNSAETTSEMSGFILKKCSELEHWHKLTKAKSTTTNPILLHILSFKNINFSVEVSK